MKDIFGKMTQKITEVKDTMAEGVENMLHLENFTDRFSGISESTNNLYAQYSSELIALSPIIEEIGFKTTEMDFSISIPPSVQLCFEKLKETTLEKKQEILELHKDNRFLAPIVKMLMTADNFQDKITLGNFKFASIKIDLGLAPGLNLKLVPKVQQQQKKIAS